MEFSQFSVTLTNRINELKSASEKCLEVSVESDVLLSDWDYTKQQ